jgi:UPF0176 protein
MGAKSIDGPGGLHELPTIETMPSFTVAAAYRFVDLPDAAVLRDRLYAGAGAAGIKGTLLLAHEGINFTLAGEPAALEAWLTALQADERFAALPIKRHGSAALPFRRLRVKVKNEIIRMNQPVVRPQAGRAPAVDPATLKRWLDQGARCDEGREVVVLDTRNGFEVDAGAFEHTLDWRLAKFSDFPAALETHRAELQGKTVVSCCTGGIRCEKAALWMQRAGIDHVLQLDGGILRYFEETDGAPHWRGRCFVFDEREQLDTHLQETA